MIRLKIKEVAQQKGVSELQLAFRSEVPASTVKHLCHNPFAETDTEVLGKLAEALRVDVSRLIESVQDEAPAS